MKDEVIWIDRGGLPIWIGFCPSEKAWKRECRRLKAGEREGAYHTGAAAAHRFTSPGRDDVCLVTVPEEGAKGRTGAEIVGIIAHEAAHAWQYTLKAMNEGEPSAEFEAYAIQRIVMELCAAYAKTRGPITVRSK